MTANANEMRLHMESFEISATIPATPERVYKAWLTGKEHAAMTGGGATGSARVGGKFTAWDGYIEGKNLELEANKRIVQSWRTSEFSDSDPDSRLEITLTPTKTGTKLTLRHSGIPDGQAASYKPGWKDHYFDPMKEYFAQSK
jgi:uncharacterized protein YndB with AHSA1/START domain